MRLLLANELDDTLFGAVFDGTIAERLRTSSASIRCASSTQEVKVGTPDEQDGCGPEWGW